MTDHVPAWNEVESSVVKDVRTALGLPASTVDRGPAWALIPWYGADGMGAPTLDDWRVWADWLMAHDPDDERDAAIAAALGVAMRVGRPDVLIALLRIRFAVSVLPRYDTGAFIGLEVQPTRREMRSAAWRAISGAMECMTGVSLDGVVVDEAHLLRMQAGAAPGAQGFPPMPAAALDGVSRWVGIPSHRRTLPSQAASAGQPRNPRRRGDTGAHGRARRR